MTTAAPPAAPLRRRCALLSEWRERRRLSQLDLADLAGTSTRHLSYVENGRSRPSRELVLRLARPSTCPSRDRNEILLAAGHAPAYADARRDAAATQRLLECSTSPSTRTTPGLRSCSMPSSTSSPPTAPSTGCSRSSTRPARPARQRRARGAGPARPVALHTSTSPAWRGHLLRQVRRHAAVGPSAGLTALLAEAQSWPRPPRRRRRPSPGPLSRLPLELDVAGQRLRLYSTVATFGTPLDVAASELALETFLPADDATRDWLAAG